MKVDKIIRAETEVLVRLTTPEVRALVYALHRSKDQKHSHISDLLDKFKTLEKRMEEYEG